MEDRKYAEFITMANTLHRQAKAGRTLGAENQRLKSTVNSLSARLGEMKRKIAQAEEQRVACEQRCNELTDRLRSLEAKLAVPV